MNASEAWQLFKTGKILKKERKRLYPKCEKCDMLATRGFYQIRYRFFCEKHFFETPKSAYITFKIDYSDEIKGKIKSFFTSKI